MKPTKLYHKGKYELFSNYIDNVNWDKEFENKSINVIYDKFLYYYNYATEEFIPTTDNHKYKRSHKYKWITPDLKTKIKAKNKMWRANKQNDWNNEPSKAEYNKLKIKIKNDVKNNIKQHVSNIASKFKTNPKLLYNYINEKKSVKTHIRALEDSKGEITNDQFAVATELNKYIYSVYVEDKDTRNIEPVNKSKSQQVTVKIILEDLRAKLNALDKSSRNQLVVIQFILMS
jgi:hypothetical protein